MTPSASRPLALLAALLVAGGLAGPAAGAAPDDLPGVAHGRGASSFSGFSTTTGLGTLSSVNSYTYDADPSRMYGPHLGAAAQQVYTTAASS